MTFRAAVLFLLMPVLALRAEDDGVQKPGLMTRTLQALHLKHRGGSQPEASRHGVQLGLQIDPTPVRLFDTRQVKATVTLTNYSRKYVHYDFPTSQRIEILVKDASGKTINTWSEDQSFTDDPATVTVNPGERLEYTASVPTREMAAGQPFTIEAFLPSAPALRAQIQVTPEK